MNNNKNNFFSNIVGKLFNFLRTMNHHWVWLFEAIFALPFLFYKLYLDIKKKRQIAHGTVLINGETQSRFINDAANKNYSLNIFFDIKNIFFRLLDIILNVFALYILQPIIQLAIAIKNLLNSSFDFAICLYQRFFSNEHNMIQSLRGELIDEIKRKHAVDRNKLKIITGGTNHQHALNTALVNHAHRIGLGVVTLIGSLLILGGLPEIGLSVLTALAVYSFIDYLGLNPLRLLIKYCNQTMDKPFAFIGEQEMVNELCMKQQNSNKKILTAFQEGSKQSASPVKTEMQRIPLQNKTKYYHPNQLRHENKFFQRKKVNQYDGVQSVTRKQMKA